MATAAAATAVLPPGTAVVAMKTPAVTVMAGAQTTINNQLKAATETVTETATMTATTMTMETKATAVAEVRRQHGGGSQLGGSGGNLGRARRWQRWQHGSSVGSGSVTAAATAWRRQWQLGENATLAAVGVR
jgi:hypothetical protein